MYPSICIESLQGNIEEKEETRTDSEGLFADESELFVFIFDEVDWREQIFAVQKLVGGKGLGRYAATASGDL